MDQVETEIPKIFLEYFRKNKDDEINFRVDFKYVNGTRFRLVKLYN